MLRKIKVKLCKSVWGNCTDFVFYVGLAEKVFWLGLGVRSQESGVGSQESGVRSQESGVRSQESGGRIRRREEEKNSLEFGQVIGFW
jgi:hypothetical protein